MLAFDENYKLVEFASHPNFCVCTSCHRLYSRFVSKQLEGHREKEEDRCPYCNHFNGSSMEDEYCISPISTKEIQQLEKISLYTEVIEFCNQQYHSSSCSFCNRNQVCTSLCSHNCKDCLAEIHFPSRYPNGKKSYDCERMLYYYVCDYSAKYASEMLYLLRKSTALHQINSYHILSIGCGACPDLMAFETYCHELSPDKTIHYAGIDVNKLWKNIHEKIEQYTSSTIQSTVFRYFDAVTSLPSIGDANVIVLQYIISYFYNTNQISQIRLFFQKLISSIIEHRQKGVPLVILINDVNSTYRGRDYFIDLVKKLQLNNYNIHHRRFYFNYQISNVHQRYGEMHTSSNILYNLPSHFNFYDPWRSCSSAQLLIEVY